MPYICERDFCIILCLFVQTACVVYAMYVKTVQIQNLLQKSGLNEVPPKKEFNNIMVFTALVNSLHILLWLVSVGYILTFCLFACFYASDVRRQRKHSSVFAVCIHSNQVYHAHGQHRSREPGIVFKNHGNLSGAPQRVETRKVHNTLPRDPVARAGWFVNAHTLWVHVRDGYHADRVLWQLLLCRKGS